MNYYAVDGWMLVTTPAGTTIQLGSGILVNVTRFDGKMPATVELLARPGVPLLVDEWGYHTSNLRKLSPLEILAMQGEPEGISTEDPEGKPEHD